MERTEALAWAELEFGRAELGDERRTRRLVRVASDAVRRPRGTVTAVVGGAAEREGAFRLLESPAVDAAAVAEASQRSTVHRMRGRPWVYVAVDQSTVSVIDRHNSKGFGRTQSGRRRGMEVTSALAIDPSGTPVGLLSQQWWIRSDELSPYRTDRKRPVEQRESDLWLRTMDQVSDRLGEEAPAPWFQLDRGADFWRVFDFAKRCRGWVTVRAAHDRCLTDGRHLRERVQSTKVAAQFRLRIPARRYPDGTRQFERVAQLSVRYAPVTLQMTTQDRKTVQAQVTAVHVRERDASKDGRIEWMLLTTWPVGCAQHALQVVHGYCQRWKIEDFHRTWKSGGCHLERSQLRSVGAFLKWATILAAVAARAERLKNLARTQPDIPATTELSRAEIDAAIVLSRNRKFKPGQELTLAQAVRLIAEAGGYTGRSSGGPPGSTTIRRGLDTVVASAEVVEALRKCD